MDRETKRNMRKEFSILLDRCGCSRAGIYMTPKEAKQTTKDLGVKFEPTIPSCTPYRCFPNLIKFLYSSRGFRGQSDMCRRALIRYKEALRQERRNLNGNPSGNGTGRRFK